MKFNNSFLALILICLLGLYLVKKIAFKPDQRSFKSELVQVDTALVDKIELYPKGSKGPRLELIKENQNWTVSDGTLNYPAVRAEVNAMLAPLSLLKTKRLISKDQTKWSDYELEEENSKRIILYSKQNKLTDLLVGRFNFDQAARTATNYVRLANESDVYSIDGFLSLIYDKDIDAFRDKSLVRGMSTDEVIKISLKDNEGISEATKNNAGQWLANNGEILDSVKVNQYLENLVSLQGQTFDKVNTVGTLEPIKILTIESDKQLTISLNTYAKSQNLNTFLLVSSLNEKAIFSSDSLGLYKIANENFLDLFK